MRQKIKLYNKNGKPVIYEGLRRTSRGTRLSTYIPTITFRKVIAKGKGTTVMNKPLTNASSEEEIAYAGIAVKYLIDIKEIDIAKDKIRKINFGKFKGSFFKTWKTKHFLDFLSHFMGTSKKLKNTFNGLQRNSLIDLVVKYSVS